VITVTWITADQRFYPDIVTKLDAIGDMNKSDELFEEAVSGINMGLYTSGFSFLKKSKSLTNPFEQIGGSFVGQWIKWEGWYTDEGSRVAHPERAKVKFEWAKNKSGNFYKDFQLHSSHFHNGSKDPDMNKPAQAHYKISESLMIAGGGKLKEYGSKDWNSYFPWSQHQFRPPQGSIGQVMQVMLQPWMVSQLIDNGKMRHNVRGLKTRRQPDKFDEKMGDADYYDVIIVANVEWYRVPENDARLKKPTPFRRKYFDKKTTDEPEKTVYGNVAWCGTLIKRKNNEWRVDTHPLHEYLFDGFRVWNDDKNNLYIGEMGFPLSTPFGQTQIINHIWKPTIRYK